MPTDSTLDAEATTKIRENLSPLESDRVRRLTFKKDLNKIDEQTRSDVRYYSNLGKESISVRLAELDREWPVDRALMTGAGFFALLGAVLSGFTKRRLMIMSAVAGVLLIVFSIFGWAPPVLILRRLGFRTRPEINLERTALKALRGDFDRVSEGQPDYETKISRAMKAAE